MANDTINYGDYAYSRKGTLLTAKDIYVYPSAQSDDGGDVNHEQNVRSISDKLICKSFVVRKLKDKDKEPLKVERVNNTTIKVSSGEAVIDGYYTNIKQSSVNFIVTNMIPTTDYLSTKVVKFGTDTDISDITDVNLRTLSVYTNSVVRVKTGNTTSTSTSENTLYRIFDPDDSSKFENLSYQEAWKIYDKLIKLEQYKKQIKSATTEEEKAAAQSRYDEVAQSLNDVSKQRRKSAKELIKKKSLYLCIILLANSTGNLRGDVTRRDGTGVLRYNQGVSFRFHTGEEIDRGDITRPYLVLAQIIPEYSPSGFKIGYVINDPNKYAYIDPDAIVTEDGMTFKEWVMAWVKEKLATLNELTYVVTDPSKDEIDEEDILDWVKKILAKLILTYDGLDVIRYRVEGDKYEYDGDGNIITVPLSEDKDYSKPDNKGHSNELNPVGDTTTYKDHGFDKTYSIDEMQRRTHIDSSSKPYKWSGTPGGTNNTREYDDEVRIAAIAKRVDSRDNQNGHHDNYPETYRTGKTAATDNRNANNGTSRLLARADHNHGTRYIFSTDAIADDSAHTQTVGTNLTVNHNEEVKEDLVVDNNAFVKQDLLVGIGNDLGKSPVLEVICSDAVTRIKGRLNLISPNDDISLISSGHIYASSHTGSGGNKVYSNIYTLAGNIYTGKETVSGTTTYGNIYTLGGDIYTTDPGTIHTNSGDIYTNTGNIKVNTSGNIGTAKGQIYVTTTSNDSPSSNAIYVKKGSLLLSEGNATLTSGNLTLSSGNLSVNGKVDVSTGRTNLKKHLIVGRTERTSDGKILEVDGSSNNYLTPENGFIYAVSENLTGYLKITGKDSLGRAIVVTQGITSLKGTNITELVVSGNTTTGSLTVTRDAAIGGSLGVIGDTEIDGTLSVVNGSTTLKELVVNDNVTIKGGIIKTNKSLLHIQNTFSGSATGIQIDKGNLFVKSDSSDTSHTYGNISTDWGITAIGPIKAIGTSGEAGKITATQDLSTLLGDIYTGGGSIYTTGSGSIYTDGGSIYTTGSGSIYTSSTGNIYTTNGSIEAKGGNGNVKASKSVTAGTSITAGTTVTATDNIETTSGDFISDNGTLTIGKNYITMNGLRLYISKTAPTGTIPVGSIGIGWE